MHSTMFLLKNKNYIEVPNYIFRYIKNNNIIFKETFFHKEDLLGQEIN